MVQAPARPAIQTRTPPYHTPGDGPRMSYEEYLAWHGEEGNAGEWVQGEVIPFVPPGLRHQRILRFLTLLLSAFVDSRHLGELIVAPFEMRLADLDRSREPDLLFVATEHLERFDAQRLNGAADVVVEILSTSSATRDRRDKLAEYAAAGIPEYWIIDPRFDPAIVELCTLTEDGYYAPIPPDSTGIIASIVLDGLTIDPAWLRQDPLPDVSKIAKSWSAKPESGHTRSTRRAPQS